MQFDFIQKHVTHNAPEVPIIHGSDDFFKMLLLLQFKRFLSETLHIGVSLPSPQSIYLVFLVRLKAVGFFFEKSVKK